MKPRIPNLSSESKLTGPGGAGQKQNQEGGIDPQMMSMLKQQLPASLFQEVVNTSFKGALGGIASNTSDSAGTVADVIAQASASMTVGTSGGGAQAEKAAETAKEEAAREVKAEEAARE